MLGLRVVTGSQAGSVIAIGSALIVGREAPPPGNLSDDPTLSRQHARIRPDGADGAIVEDLGSTAGTLVNGRRIDGPTAVRAGDRLDFGKVSATVEARSVPQRPEPYGGGDARQTQLNSALPRHEAFGSQQAAAPGSAAPLAGAAGTTAGSSPAWQTPTAPAGRKKRSRIPLVVGAVALLAAAGVGGYLSGHASTSSASSADDANGTPAFVCVPADSGRAGAGHFRFNTSACENGTTNVTEFRLPIHKGVSGGHTVWYVVMDVSDKATAARLGVNYVPKLANAKGTKAVQKVTVAAGGTVSFPGTVDFNHKRVLVASATGFPPTKAAPPAVGDANYSPLIELPGGIVENAPQIANSTGRADKVITLDTTKKTVVFRAQHGFYENKSVHYASFDASDPGVAAIEDVTYAPNLNAAPSADDEDAKTSARETLIAFTNGPSTPGDVQDQGLNFALKTGGANPTPLNLLHEAPLLPKHPAVGSLDYTALWDVHLAQWTRFAVDGGGRTQFRSVNSVLADLVASVDGAKPLVTGPGGAKFGAAGVVVNCPLVSIDIP